MACCSPKVILCDVEGCKSRCDLDCPKNQDVTADLIAWGWKVTDDGKHYCQSHKDYQDVQVTEGAD